MTAVPNFSVPSLVAAVVASVVVAAALFWGPRVAAADDASAAESAARDVMEAFLQAFNDRDEAAWADTLHFPHVRLASGDVLVYQDRAAFLDAMDLAAFAEQIGWDYSTWDDMQIVQSSAQKVHIAVNFTRFDPQGAAIATYASLYVVEQIDGRWGVRARSSFAP